MADKKERKSAARKPKERTCKACGAPRVRMGPRVPNPDEQEGQMSTYTPKLIVVGHGRHGKGTFADMIAERIPWVKSMSSSWFALEKVVWPAIGKDYETKEQCFENRINRRDEWFQLISSYNRDDKARLARELFKEHSICTGMRCWEEFLKAREVADLTVWIDRSKVLPPEPRSSMTISAEDCDVIVDNNGSLDDLARRVTRICGAVYHQLDLEQ